MKYFEHFGEPKFFKDTTDITISKCTSAQICTTVVRKQINILAARSILCTLHILLDTFEPGKESLELHYRKYKVIVS